MEIQKHNQYSFLSINDNEIISKLNPVATIKQHNFAVSLKVQYESTPNTYQDTYGMISIGSLRTLLGDGIVLLVSKLLSSYFDFMGMTITAESKKMILKTLFTHPDYKLLSISDIKLAMEQMTQKKHFGKPTGADVIAQIKEYQINRTDYFDDKHFKQHQQGNG